MTPARVSCAPAPCTKSGTAFWRAKPRGRGHGRSLYSSAGASITCDHDLLRDRFPRGNQQKKSELASERPHQSPRIQLPDQAIERSSKARGGFVQKKVPRAEFLPELDLLKSTHQGSRFVQSEGICSGTLQIVVDRAP